MDNVQDITKPTAAPAYFEVEPQRVKKSVEDCFCEYYEQVPTANSMAYVWRNF